MQSQRSASYARRSVAWTIVAVILFAGVSAPSAAGTRLAPLAPPAASQRGTAPQVVYSTLLGGAEGNFDAANDVAVDAAGNAYVVGTTDSSDFPTRNALQASLEGDSDAFVAKFGPDGELIFSTLLGGSGYESATAVAVDASGAIYVAGLTGSSDFPRENAFQSSLGGLADAFVTKLEPDGRSIVFSSYLGGSGDDEAEDIAIDSDGMVYVAGTVSRFGVPNVTFPVVNPIQESYGGGDTDAFASFVSPTGGSLVFSTLLDVGFAGGLASGRDQISSMRVDSVTGDVFIAGFVEFNENEPEVPFIGRYRPDPVPGGLGKAHAPPQAVYSYVHLLVSQIESGDLEPPEEFGVKLSIAWMAGLTGASGDRQGGSGSALGLATIVEGYCHSGSTGPRCDEPAAFTTFSPNLEFDGATNLPVLREFFFDAGTTGAQDAVYIAGDVFSNRLTTVNPFQATYGGNDDVVVAVLAPGTLEPAMVSFFGGDGFDLPRAIATDADGNIFVAGLTTLSTVFPTTPGAFQSLLKGDTDAFLAKISAVGPFPDAPDFSLSFDPATIQVSRGSKVILPLLIERVGGFTGNVKITPPAQVPGFKSPKKKPTVPGDSTVLKFKVKADAPLGPTSFTFTGTDPEGRTRSATITLEVQ